MKKEINKVLGNSLRCILPSFWWKRLLGKMVDKIESAESSASSAMNMATLAGLEASDKQDRLVSGSNIKTINQQSILGSGNIVVDTDKVEKYKTKDDLDANGSLAGGDIAAVVDDLLVEKPFSECYLPTLSEIEANPYNKKFTKVDGISLNPDFNPSLISSNYGSLRVKLYSDGNSKGYYKEYPSRLEIECDYDRRIFYYEYEGTSGTGNRLYDSSGFYADAIDRVNNILREGDFRFSYCEVTYKKNADDIGYRYYYSYSNDWLSDASAMINNVVKMLFAETQNADIYVKSAEWVKLLKEGDVTGGGGLEIREFYTGESLTDEQKAWNLETAQAILDKKAIVTCNGSILGDAITTNDDGSKEFINSAPTQQGVLYAGVKVEEDGTASIFFRQLYLDDSLSDKSINAVQNKVITAALEEKADKTDIKTLNGVSLLGGGNLQLGDGQTIVYDDSAVYDRIAEVEELAAQAKVSSELAIEELNIHLEEVNVALFDVLSNHSKLIDELAAELRALTSRVKALEDK